MSHSWAQLSDYYYWFSLAGEGEDGEVAPDGGAKTSVTRLGTVSVGSGDTSLELWQVGLVDKEEEFYYVNIYFLLNSAPGSWREETKLLVFTAVLFVYPEGS
jgi:hypothetical protein